METRVLLREGRSIRENKFSYDKEVSMEKELLYEAHFSLWKKECYYEKEVLFWKTKKQYFRILSWDTPNSKTSKKTKKN